MNPIIKRLLQFNPRFCYSSAECDSLLASDQYEPNEVWLHVTPAHGSVAILNQEYCVCYLERNVSEKIVLCE